MFLLYAKHDIKHKIITFQILYAYFDTGEHGGIVKDLQGVEL